MFCQENYLGCKTLQMIAQMKHQFAEQLASIGFLQGQLKCRDMERAARFVKSHCRTTTSRLTLLLFPTEAAAGPTRWRL